MVINVYYYHSVTLPGFQVLYCQYSQLGAGMLKSKKTQKVLCNANVFSKKNHYELLFLIMEKKKKNFKNAFLGCYAYYLIL